MSISRKVVAFLKNANQKKFKIEEAKVSKPLGDCEYWYHILYENGERMRSDFTSKQAAIRWLESEVGSCQSY